MDGMIHIFQTFVTLTILTCSERRADSQLFFVDFVLPQVSRRSKKHSDVAERSEHRSPPSLNHCTITHVHE